MIDVKSTVQFCAFSATVGVIDGAIAAGIAALVAGTSAAVTAFAIVGGISTVVAGGAYALCQAAAEADRMMMYE